MLFADDTEFVADSKAKLRDSVLEFKGMSQAKGGEINLAKVKLRNLLQIPKKLIKVRCLKGGWGNPSYLRVDIVAFCSKG